MTNSFFVESNNRDTVVKKTKLPYISLDTNVLFFEQQERTKQLYCIMYNDVLNVYSDKP